MRVLIVGAGIAGLSLAAMLRFRGIEPPLVEKATPDQDGGYVIGLWPMGTRVLHGLNLYEEFAREALPMHTYRLCDGKGDPIKEFSLDRIAAEFGYIGLLERQQLIRLLRSRVSPESIRWGVTVEALAQSRDEVRVTLRDGTSHGCDLVVGADGIHSRVRDLIAGPSPHWNTNWGLWGWWVDSGLVSDRAATEYWRGARFLGIYPALHRASVFAGAPLAAWHPGEAGGARSASKTSLPPSANESHRSSTPYPGTGSLSTFGIFTTRAQRYGLRAASYCSAIPRLRFSPPPGLGRPWRWSPPPCWRTNSPAATRRVSRLRFTCSSNDGAPGCSPPRKTPASWQS